MTESETIARWRGFRHIKKGDQWAWYGPEDCIQPFFGHEPPNFRISNEWAGAVLEKLSAIANVVLGDKPWECEVYTDHGWAIMKSGATWRDAVVDATLEVIKREDSADEPLNGNGDA